MFEINVNASIEIHLHGDVAKQSELKDMLTALSHQLKKGFMHMRQDLIDFSARVDTATTAISDRIDRLVAASTSLTAEEKAELTALADHLDAIGKDPADPTPPIPPE